MGRVVAIVKYLPAAMCGLLLVAWVGTWFGARLDWLTSRTDVYLQPSGLHLAIADFSQHEPSIDFIAPRSQAFEFTFGRLTAYYYFSSQEWLLGGSCPIPLLVTLALPFALAPLLHFRYPLWSYFAWTALVGVELAFYLR